MKRFLGRPLSEYVPVLALLAVTAIYLVTGYRYSAAARAFPIAVAWVMIALIGLDFVSRTKTALGRAILQWLNPAADPEKGERQQHFARSKQIAAVLWLAAFVALLVLIGILPAVAIYVFASIVIRGRRPYRKGLLASAAITLFIWLLFAQLLELELYPGMLFGEN